MNALLSISTLPFSLLFILALLIPLRYANTTETVSDDIINATCQTCTMTMPPTFSSAFCSASLAAIPVSHVTNLAGLGLVSLELALVNATNTMLTIDSMLRKGDTRLCKTCLVSCLDLYADVSSKLEECVGEYMDGGYPDVYLWITEIKLANAMCEGGFRGKGLESPVAKESYSLSQLSNIVQCIISMISPILNPIPSISA